MITPSSRQSAGTVLKEPLATPVPAPVSSANEIALVILLSISFSHLLNDTIQSLIPAIYPLLKNSLSLLGKLADHTSIEYVYKVCLFLPLI